ncbi:hypothetical protein EB796_014613 [Bugula neritina]|uniref:Reverse transcriptase n=1 Tax=Bugula neritina TaxID=10212 RepID=A0A7J7JM48_BUGNE|nr:hypothetical protein EB796_014613 [Bugula neritina]
MCRLIGANDTRTSMLIDQRDLAAPVISGKTVSTSDSLVSIWREKLDDSVDGKGLLFHRDVPEAHRWAREPTRILTGRDFVRVNHLRFNLLLTGQLKFRMCRQANIFCPVCPNRPHTLGHILQVCPRSHGPRIQRHNKICEFVQKKLLEKGYEVLWEPHIKTGRGFLKPDLMYWKKEDPDIVRVLDIGITSDSVRPSVPYLEKVKKYDIDSVRKFAQEVSALDSVWVGALIINWRGAIALDSKNFLKGVIDSRDWAILSLRTLQYGVYSYDFWNKTTCTVEPVNEVDW